MYRVKTFFNSLFTNNKNLIYNNINDTAIDGNVRHFYYYIRGKKEIYKKIEKKINLHFIWK